MDNNGRLHIVMLPWLALGHLQTFLELSKRIAQKGHRISFLSTPKNIQRLPKIPQHISPLINLVQFPLPPTENLPAGVEVTIDLPYDDLRPYLKKAFDGLRQNVLNFLQENSNPPVDWIIYDYAAYWIPSVSAECGVPCAYFSTFNAATLGFVGPPQVLLGKEDQRTTVHEYTVAPKWVPFPSIIAYKEYEARQEVEPAIKQDASGVNELYRFALTIEGCDFLAIRSCIEFEPEWLELIGELFHKDIVPVGMLPPIIQEDSNEKEWESTFRWLDQQEAGSVVYVAFGSEAKLTSAQVEQIAIGLELTQLPFLWAFRAGKAPEGFEERTKCRGFVCFDWVPQIRILAHRSIGGFLTHGGWSSIVEGISFGLKMVVLPLMFDQGLNARNLVERGVAAEVPRNVEDGSFTGEGIAESLRLVMVEEKGETLRAKVREYRDTFGDMEMQDKRLDDFIKYLLSHKQKKVLSTTV
ncbi:uncharacterized protein A4U43_C04F7420 [Asparagus officinalis]|uniref:Glycosyltransferase n=1 Tax=Asparagus officinalis TaxID=4686 RepID=A0A5P1EZ14_ASPOF|nr:UDP-glycosyltransferase 91C1-like [Asparagus officinalis]ONK71335.1 uncharacterized protein A4U43_C04F7420 [Asparagus officinalis]